jgi:hypothetical protein
MGLRCNSLGTDFLSPRSGTDFLSPRSYNPQTVKSDATCLKCPTLRV